jgi:hypothetical protein
MMRHAISQLSLSDETGENLRSNYGLYECRVPEDVAVKPSQKT